MTDWDSVQDEVDRFSQKRTGYSIAAFVAYVVAVVATDSLTVAVVGGVGVLVIRSWAIDRILYANGVGASTQRSAEGAAERRAIQEVWKEVRRLRKDIRSLSHSQRR